MFGSVGNSFGSAGRSFGSVGSSFGGRETLNRGTAAERSWNPLNNIRADRFSFLNSSPASSSTSTRSYSRAPSSTTTFVWPWSRPSSTVYLGSSSSVGFTSLRWLGVAMAVLGVSLAIIGAVAYAPPLVVMGAATAVAGGILAAVG